VSPPAIPPHLIARVVREALDEDIGPGDVTTDAIVPEGAKAHAVITTRTPIVVSGVAVALAAFSSLDPGVAVSTCAPEGGSLPAGATLLEVGGKARALLTAERTAMNFLAHLSGVATFTRRCVDAAERAAAGRRIEVSDTRKTTPNLRLLEKMAVSSGGGANHRQGLWDACLIKDNHIAMAGGIEAAVTLARRASGAETKVATEVRDLEELELAIKAGTDAVLLDNFPNTLIREAIAMVAGRVMIEVSGGVTLESLPELASLGVDRISMGSLTHSAPSADLTMRIEPWTS
jgi:nicotinate-nucleotide pyrophosphorylase (carboxylating)